jgi:hypothetical protein
VRQERQVHGGRLARDQYNRLLAENFLFIGRLLGPFQLIMNLYKGMLILRALWSDDIVSVASYKCRKREYDMA